MLAIFHAIVRSSSVLASVFRKIGPLLIMAAWITFDPGVAAADIDITPGESFMIFFTMPSVLVGTVQDLEVVPQTMSTLSSDPNFVTDEVGRATLTLNGTGLGTGTFHNFETGSLGAFADPVNSIVSPAVPVNDFASLVVPGESGVFVFSVLAGDVMLDPAGLLIELGNGNGTYNPDNSPVIDRTLLLIPEPPSIALAATAVALLLTSRRRRRDAL